MKLTKEQFEKRKREVPVVKAHHWYGSDELSKVIDKRYDYFVDEDAALFYVLKRVRK